MGAGDDIDPATVTSARGGNRLVPGLAAFTGITFLVYLFVKAGSGAVPMDGGFWVQIAVSAALLGYGAGLMWRGRYFYVLVTTAEGTRRLAGLTRAEQQALLARLEKSEPR